MTRNALTLARLAFPLSLLAVSSGTRSLVAQERPDDVLGRAMRDELARSMKELRLGDLARPYFIAYRVRETRSLTAAAGYGSLLSSEESRDRVLAVEVRVGDYAFDNTNFMGGGSSGGLVAIGSGGSMVSLGATQLPLDDDYLEIRRSLWRATDGAYKEAAETFSAKRAALLNRARADTLADFTKETPTQTVDEIPPAVLSRRDAEALVRELSGLPELAGLSSSTVSLELNNEVTRFFNSEGTTYTVSRPLLTVQVSAAMQAADGQPLSSSWRVRARSIAELPPRDQLARAVRDFAIRIDSLRTAPIVDRYSGPVLFEARAGAELFAELFAPALAGRRRAESGDPAMGAMLESMGGGGRSLSDKVGSRVLPELLSVFDDPTKTTHGQRPLLGAYRVDDEGVVGRRKAIIEAGILKTVLSSRTPVEGMPQSSGNARGSGAAPSNMIVEATASESDGELRARLLALVKKRGLKYGFIVSELGAAATLVPEDPMAMFAAMRERGGGGRGVLRVYRVYPDGREELVRGARLTGMTPQSFKDIVAVSATPTVYDRAAGGSADLGALMFEEMLGDEIPVSAIASYVVPALLFEDLSITRTTGELPKPPLSAPPTKK